MIIYLLHTFIVDLKEICCYKYILYTQIIICKYSKGFYSIYYKQYVSVTNNIVS